MKKLSSLLLLLIICLTLGGCNKADAIYIALSPDYAPYEFVDSRKTGDSRYVGADVELAKFIADELGKELVLQPMGFDQTLTAVQTGKVDLAISGFTYKEERANNYELSITYRVDGEGKQGILILKSNQDKYPDFASLNKSSVKVGAQAGSVQEDYVKEQLSDSTLEKIQKIDTAVEYLKAGKIDALAVASEVADGIITNDNSLVMLPEYFEIEDSNLYVIGKKGNTELMEQVNKAIEKVVAHNLYEIWIMEYKALFAILGDAATEEDLTD